MYFFFFFTYRGRNACITWNIENSIELLTVIIILSLIYFCNIMLHPLPGPYHHNSLLFRAGLEPGILGREVGALPRRLKATASSVSR